MKRSAKPSSLVLLLLAGAAALLASTQPWLRIVLTQSGEPLEVTGGQALSLLTPLGLAALALTGALAITGPRTGTVLAVLGLVIGLGITAMSAPVLFAVDPSLYAHVVTTATGIAGSTGIGSLVRSVETTAWPVLGTVAGLLVVVASIRILATRRHWKSGSRRYEASRARTASGPLDAVDSWDELSRGEDPTGPADPR